MDCVFCSNQIAPGQMAVKILSAYNTVGRPEGQLDLEIGTTPFEEYGHIGCYLETIVKEPTAAGAA